MSDVQIFQVFGVLYAVIGVGMFLNQEFYKKLFLDFVESPAMMYIGGIMALIVGYLLVTFHNVWVMNWTVIITVFGWMALIKGMTILIRPNWMVDLTKAIISKEGFLRIEAVFVTILGLLFLFLGFCPKSPLANIL
ncbi:MAG: hypothetical protein KAJ07_07855 [Planctomycetes bacterium]|nr:hypothetical protein [Planctomycetota bacterium]